MTTATALLVAISVTSQLTVNVDYDAEKPTITIRDHSGRHLYFKEKDGTRWVTSAEPGNNGELEIAEIYQGLRIVGERDGAFSDQKFFNVKPVQQNLGLVIRTRPQTTTATVPRSTVPSLQRIVPAPTMPSAVCPAYDYCSSFGYEYAAPVVIAAPTTSYYVPTTSYYVPTNCCYPPTTYVWEQPAEYNFTGF